METKRSSSLRLNIRILSILIIVLIILQLTIPYRGWLILLIVLGGVWLISYIWVKSLYNHLHLEREMRSGWARVGDAFEERFRLVNKGWFPALWVEIEDHSTIPDYSVSRATGVGSYSENSWHTRQVCSRRGLFSLGPTTLRTGDPFGIYTMSVDDFSQATLLVTPPVLPLPQIEVAPGGRAGEGRLARSALERTITSSGVRNYVSGDSLRWVHWPTSARRNNYYIKTFDSTPSSDWWILLDLDQSVQAGDLKTNTEEAGIILAASLANRGIDSGLAVGLVVNTDDLVWLPPRSGDIQRWNILQVLARVNAGQRSLIELLQASKSSFRDTTSLVIITPSVQVEWVEPLLSLVWRGVIPTILLIDPESFGGENSGSELASLLSDLNLVTFKITADIFDKPPIAKEKLNVWDWRVMPTGKAVPVHKPADLTWKTLS